MASDSSKAKKAIVSTEKGLLRLDCWLSEQAGVTRSQAQRLIREGVVTVNGIHTVKSGASVGNGDRVEWTEPVMPQQTTAPALEVCYEDDALLVVNKPAGIAVHHASGYLGPTIVDSIQVHRGVVDWDERAGLVHRLDKDTSGVLLIAKGPEILHSLQLQWQGRTIHKEYIALVVGVLQPLRGTIDSPIARSMHNRQQMRVTREGKDSITHYTVLKHFKDCSLVQLQPVTGRTHQIRVHCAAIGYPVAGDTTYGNAVANRRFQEIGLTRQFLHASKLTITHPVTGKSLTCTAPLPPDLQRVLDMLQ